MTRRTPIEEERPQEMEEEEESPSYEYSSSSSGGFFSALASCSFGLIILAILCAVGSKILGEVSNVQSTGYRYNVTESGQEAIWNVAQWFPTMGLVVGATMIIGIVFRSMMAFSER